MKKNKFYVVWVGNKTGVFESWVECQIAVKNYKGSKYKSFIKKNEAEKAFLEGYEFYYNKKNIIKVYYTLNRPSKHSRIIAIFIMVLV